jgi:2-keto-3-deoxy-galactonokinase
VHRDPRGDRPNTLVLAAKETAGLPPVDGARMGSYQEEVQSVVVACTWNRAATETVVVCGVVGGSAGWPRQPWDAGRGL